MTRGAVRSERTRADRFPWLHLAAGGVTMVVLSFAIGMSGFFFIDEAALLGQLELRAEGEWVTPRPLTDLDATGELVPMVRSYVTDDAYAPFAKHPLHVEIASLADQIGGRVGVRLLSTLGVLVAAASSALLALRASRSAAVAAFWIALTASPLVFQAQLLVGHALAAAVGGATFVALTRSRSRARVVLVGVLVVGGALLRSEFVVLGLSIAVVYGSVGVWRRRADHGVLAVVSGAAAVGAYVVEPIVVRWVAGGSATPQVIGDATSGGFAARLEATNQALFGSLVGPHGSVSRSVLLLIVVLAVTVAGWRRFRPDDPGPAVALGVLSVVAGMVWLARPAIASGFVVAFPLVVLLAWPGAWHRTRSTLGEGAEVGQAEGWILAVAGVFMLAVLLLQYREVGGLEWGWRYVAVVLPAICGWLGAVLVQLWRQDDALSRVALVLVVVAAWLVPIGGLRVQRDYLRNTGAFEASVERLVADESVDWILSLDASFGRFAYEVSLGGRLVSLDERQVTTLLTQLAERGVDRVLVVWRGDGPAPGVDAGFDVRGEPEPLASGYRSQLLVRDA